MSYTRMATDMVWLMVVVLLSVMLLVWLMLKFLGHIHLHISLLAMTTIHHDMLALLVALVVHVIWIVTGCLRNWGARR